MIHFPTLIPLKEVGQHVFHYCGKDSDITFTTGLPDVNPPQERSGC
jgi:hypothetical protein